MLVVFKLVEVEFPLLAMMTDSSAESSTKFDRLSVGVAKELCKNWAVFLVRLRFC